MTASAGRAPPSCGSPAIVHRHCPALGAGAGPTPAARKDPLYRLVARHLETFLHESDARFRSGERGGGLPRFVRRELREYLSCGILANGSARVHCTDCGKDALVAFSCKKRGF